jgi:hypothetical protein
MPGVITKNQLFRCVKIKDRDDILHITDVCNKLNCIYREMDGFLTIREILQFFGTNIVRKIYGDAWVNATINDILREKPQIAIIPDARFQNEFRAINRAGGRVIKLTRSIDDDNHISERDIDSYTSFDAKIDNRDMTIQEQNKATFDLLKSWDWLDIQIDN